MRDKNNDKEARNTSAVDSRTRCSTSPNQDSVPSKSAKAAENEEVTKPKHAKITAYLSKKKSGLFTRSSWAKSSWRATMDPRDYVLVSYSVRWVDGETEITDKFLWPKRERDVKQMRMFAIDYLSDLLGAKELAKCLPMHIKAFASYIAYAINREIDIHDNSSEFSPDKLIKSGRLSQALVDRHEHLVPISIDVGEYQDCFEWDISNPDNDPQEFAAQTVRDLQLKPELEYTVAIACSIT